MLTRGIEKVQDERAIGSKYVCKISANMQQKIFQMALKIAIYPSIYTKTLRN